MRENITSLIGAVFALTFMFLMINNFEQTSKTEGNWFALAMILLPGITILAFILHFIKNKK